MHQVRCCDCGNKLEANRTNRLYCAPCRKVRKNESAKLWAIENSARVKATQHNWYVRFRKNDPGWHLDNKAQAKAWRIANPEKSAQYHPPKHRPASHAAHP